MADARVREQDTIAVRLDEDDGYHPVAKLASSANSGMSVHVQLQCTYIVYSGAMKERSRFEMTAGCR
ncbi:hypothetical protein KC344_g105 [Hortaea werneckii]|nr:hypothetical protein KC344_g105 [Hortaea werneckii]